MDSHFYFATYKVMKETGNVVESSIMAKADNPFFAMQKMVEHIKANNDNSYNNYKILHFTSFIRIE
jgi:hypothetical protein